MDKKFIKQWLDRNIWDGEDRSGSQDTVFLKPDDLQVLVEECLEAALSQQAERTWTPEAEAHLDQQVALLAELEKREARIAELEGQLSKQADSAEPAYWTDGKSLVTHSYKQDAIDRLWPEAVREYKVALYTAHQPSAVPNKVHAVDAPAHILTESYRYQWAAGWNDCRDFIFVLAASQTLKGKTKCVKR